MPETLKPWKGPFRDARDGSCVKCERPGEYFARTHGGTFDCCREHSIEALVSSDGGGLTFEEATSALDEIDRERWRSRNTHKMTWVPCSERLPDEGGVFPYVLAKVGGMFYPVIARRSETSTGWVELGDQRLFAAWEITHWMPLPELPS